MASKDNGFQVPFGNMMRSSFVPPVMDIAIRLHLLQDNLFLGFAEGDDQQDFVRVINLQQIKEFLFAY